MGMMDEIEESLRICEEILGNNPDFVSEKPDFEELDMTISGAPVQEEKIKTPVKQEVQKEVPEKVQIKVDVPEKEDAHPITSEKVDTSVTEMEEATREGSTLVGTLIRFGGCVLVAFLVAFLLTYFVVNHTTVEGNSMEPCLQDGDELVVEKVSYLTGEPERFDIIVFEQSEDVNYIKLVIGLPGETVQIKDEKIYINGRALFDEFRKEKMKSAGIAKKEIVLGTDEYFVLGDNRNASKDSRDAEVGTVKSKQIRGKAWIRVLPFDNFGEIR